MNTISCSTEVYLKLSKDLPIPLQRNLTQPGISRQVPLSWLLTHRTEPAQITSVQPGFFKTDLQNKVPILDRHPAYASPGLPAYRGREILSQGYSTTEIAFGETKKGAEKIYEVTMLDQPPLWLPLGKDCLERTAAHAAEFQKVVAQFAHWSDDLLPAENFDVKGKGPFVTDPDSYDFTGGNGTTKIPGHFMYWRVPRNRTINHTVFVLI